MKRASSKAAWAIRNLVRLRPRPDSAGHGRCARRSPALSARGPRGRLGVAAAAVAVTAIGVWASTVVARELHEKDPQLVVVDEVAGLLVTMLPVAAPSWYSVAIGFALFRLFDVVKPWPVRRLESLPSGWGIVLDDVAAGALGAIVMIGVQALPRLIGR